MDFDRAAARLAADHSTLKSKRRTKQTGLAVSAKAKREAEERRRRTAERLAEQRRVRARVGYGVRYMERCDARLGVVRDLGRSAGTGGGSAEAAPAGMGTAATTTGQGQASPTWNPTPSLLLRPTSIHGDGDKLSLPPSVLAHLADSGVMGGSGGDGGYGGGGGGNPLAFRVGILNPDYSGFPSSPKMAELVENVVVDESGEVAEDDDDDDDDDYVSDSDDPMEDGDAEGQDNKRRKRRAAHQTTGPYLDELSHKYVAYTHATVVEFTQDEGRVGLPLSVARALLGDTAINNDGEGLEGKKSGAVPRTRTVDPASEGPMDGKGIVDATEDGSDADTDVDMTSTSATNADHPTANKVDPSAAATDDDGEKTPGHLAWGAFDVPDTLVEITLIKLPKGKGCTLVPTPQSVRSGFYGLKDVKLVLEQSLIRTRATLSVNDVVHAWHRGTKFDLVVRDVTPGDFGAVSCINTDIEVDLAPPETDVAASGGGGGGGGKVEERQATATATATGGSDAFAPGTGHRLSDGPATVIPPTTAPPTKAEATVHLSPEPPADQVENVCTVQVRGDGATGRRRFDVIHTTIRDLFAFASSACNMNDAEGMTFRLVTRFPRRVFSIGDGGKSLADAGIGQGQEMFMVERL